jgi:O-antigen ligase
VAALAVCAYAVAVTQTLAALAAVVLGSLILWGMVLFGAEAGAGAGAGERPGESGQDEAGAPRGRSGAWRPALLLGAILALAVGVVVAVPSLRARAAAKLLQARQGSWDEVLTGRLDGWRAALWMFDQHPWAGVGHGAYRVEFAPAKLALLARGTAFSPGQQQNFVNAHDEILEVAADCGLPGLATLLWGSWVVVAALRRRPPGSLGSPGPADVLGHALAVAGTAALAVLCLVDFPFRIGLLAFPALLFLAWVLRPAAGTR